MIQSHILWLKTLSSDKIKALPLLTFCMDAPDVFRNSLMGYDVEPPMICQDE